MVSHCFFCLSSEFYSFLLPLELNFPLSFLYLQTLLLTLVNFFIYFFLSFIPLLISVLILLDFSVRFDAIA